MKAAFVTAIAAFVMAAGTARAQEPKLHDHEHAQPPAVAEQQEQAERKEMCACCTMDGDMASMKDTKAKMQDKMQGHMQGQMQGPMKDMKKDSMKK